MLSPSVGDDGVSVGVLSSSVGVLSASDGVLWPSEGVVSSSVGDVWSSGAVVPVPVVSDAAGAGLSVAKAAGADSSASGAMTDVAAMVTMARRSFMKTS